MPRLESFSAKCSQLFLALTKISACRHWFSSIKCANAAVLLPLFKKIAYKKGSYFGLVALSSVAKDVALFINSDNATFNGKPIEFGEAIRKFVNASAMVQATSIVGTQNDDAVVKSIGIVYPPNFEGKATIENSPYYGTSIKSKFAFKLPKT